MKAVVLEPEADPSPQLALRKVGERFGTIGFRSGIDPRIRGSQSCGNLGNQPLEGFDVRARHRTGAVREQQTRGDFVPCALCRGVDQLPRRTDPTPAKPAYWFCPVCR